MSGDWRNDVDEMQDAAKRSDLALDWVINWVMAQDDQARDHCGAAPSTWSRVSG